MTPTLRGRARGLFVLPVVAGLLVAPTAGALAAAHKTPAKPHVTVMTQNLYLGADLTPMIAAVNPIAGIASIAAAVEASQPDKRMAAVANEIAKARPLLVGLQEVANWKIPGKSPLDGTQLVPPASYDFLALLRHDLAAKGLHYRVVITQTNFDSSKQLPAAAGALASFTDRDVILARRVPTSKLKVVSTHAAHYKHQLEVPVASLGTTVNFNRGYEWANLVSNSKKWRFVNTHPEAYTPAQLGLPGTDVNGPQAAELVAALKSYARPIVVASDLNSAKNDPSLQGYRVYMKAGYHDTWLQLGLPETGYTCCRNATLTSGPLSERIDHVLSHGKVKALKASRVGVSSIASTEPRWASDHSGLLTTVAIG